jgi:hypothetical protein
MKVKKSKMEEALHDVVILGQVREELSRGMGRLIQLIREGQNRPAPRELEGMAI